MFERLGKWLFGPYEQRSETPGSTGVVIPSRDKGVTERQLLSTINVYRAVSLLALGAGQLTADVWRGGEQIPRPSLIRMPDLHVRWRPWVKLNVASLATTGNAYWLLTRNDRSEVTNIKVLSPSECEPDENGTLQWGRRKKPLQPSEFRHLRLLELPGVLKGLGPIQAARTELSGAMEVTKYGSEFFNTGDVPSGILKSDQHLTPEQAQGYKVLWQERKAHEVAVLGSGLDYKPILLSPEDAQFIATRQFDTTAIARLFGIPARLFLASVEGGSMTYANIAQDDLAFVRWTLSDYLGAIEDALSSVLPGIQEARFNLDGVLRPDATARYAAHEAGIRAGWLLKSEVREIEGLPPVSDIDKPAAPPPAAPKENDEPAA